MTETRPEHVLCHSGYEYAEYPVAFYWDGQRVEIDHILASWRSPQGKYFRVSASDKRVFELFYDLSEDSWRIELR